MVEQIGPAEVARRLAEGAQRLVLLDVREPWERALARIEPSLHIPLNDLPLRLSEIPNDVPVVVYCHSGHRSAVVAAFLTNQGLPKVANLAGGIDEWSRTVDPTVPRY